MDKICPVMSRPSDNVRITTIGGTFQQILEVNCQREKCQWWWKCKESEMKEVSG